MTGSRERRWFTGLTAILAGLYAWVAMAGQDLDRVLGLTGAVLILISLAAAWKSQAAAVVLLVAGTLPLAIVTWWSLVTPLIAVLAIVLGWTAMFANLASPSPSSSRSC